MTSLLSCARMRQSFALLISVLLVTLALWPPVDLGVSGLFFHVENGFFLVNWPPFVAIHWVATAGARVLAVGLALAVLGSWWQRRALVGISAKGWAFLLLALLVGPGLVANAGFKDHWGRARPREIVEFGGTQPFTSALAPHFERARSNGSFVAGDAAFGFFLPSFAYVVPRRRSRRVFWVGMAAGALCGLARIAMGAHFLSDVVAAAFLMLAVCAALHAAMYGRAETAAVWRRWVTRSAQEV